MYFPDGPGHTGFVPPEDLLPPQEIPTYSNTTAPVPETSEPRRRTWRGSVRPRRVRRLKRKVVYKYGKARIKGVGAGTGQVPNAVTAPPPSESARKEVAASVVQLKYTVREMAHRAAVAGTELESRATPPLYPGTTRRAAYHMAGHPVENTQRLWRRFWHLPRY